MGKWLGRLESKGQIASREVAASQGRGKKVLMCVPEDAPEPSQTTVARYYSVVCLVLPVLADRTRDGETGCSFCSMGLVQTAVVVTQAVVFGAAAGVCVRNPDWGHLSVSGGDFNPRSGFAAVPEGHVSRRRERGRVSRTKERGTYPFQAGIPILASIFSLSRGISNPRPHFSRKELDYTNPPYVSSCHSAFVPCLLAQATPSRTRRDWVARLGDRPRLRRDLQQDKA